MTRVLFVDRPGGGPVGEPAGRPWTFHQAIPGYQPTPLESLPELAARFGVRQVDLKLETDRFGLPSFKIMGASWAVVQALGDHLPPGWQPEHGLAPLAGTLPALTLVAATDGNHGRALAWVGRHLGLPVRIFVPDALSNARIATIEDEGAEVVRVAGTYDDAVARSAADAERRGTVLVSDTSWPGYERVPTAVIDGYATILLEVEDQRARRGFSVPDLVFVQLGVGAFAAAVIRHFRRLPGRTPRIVGVEPTNAACVMASLAAGRRVTVPGPHKSVMAGLNCGTPSFVAWPLLTHGLDAVMAIDDELAIDGVRTLAGLGLAVGECSGVVVTAARELLAGVHSDAYRERLGIPNDASVLLFATEGVTDGAEAPVQVTSTMRGSL